MWKTCNAHAYKDAAANNSWSEERKVQQEEY